MNREWKIFAAVLAIFLVAYFVPLATPQFAAEADPLAAPLTGAIVAALMLLPWCARNHTLARVVPALFIAGAITTFLSPESVLKHLGPRANKAAASAVASVSGSVLAVCSCSVLPMFAGIWMLRADRSGAGCSTAVRDGGSCPFCLLWLILLTPSIGFSADFNIADYGAVPGGGDDLAAFQQAIQAAAAGDRVLIPTGTYQVSASIVPKADITILGAGRDQSIVEHVGSPGTQNLPMIHLQSISNVELSGFTLDGKNSNKASHGILAEFSTGHSIHDMGFRDFTLNSGLLGSHAIHFQNSVDHSRIERNQFRSIGLNSEFGLAIRLTESRFNRIAENDIQDVGRSGILTESDSTDNVIRGNTVAGSGRYAGTDRVARGIEIGSQSDRTIVADNLIDHGLRVEQSGLVAVRRNTVLATDGSVEYAGLELAGGSDVIVSHNIVGRGSQLGLSIAGSGPKQRVYFAGNTFSAAETWGAEIQDDEGIVRQIYFFDNLFAGAENDGDELDEAATAGFRLRSVNQSEGSGIEQLVFDSNQIIDNDEIGLQFFGLQSEEGDIDKLAFRNNLIANNGGNAIAGGVGFEHIDWDASNLVTGNGLNNTLSSLGFQNGAPVTAIVADPTVAVGETMDFSLAYFDDNSVVPAELLWDFDEGLPVVESTPSHTFATAGVYEVTLLVWDKQGRAARSARQITVVAPSAGDFDLDSDVDGADFLQWQRGGSPRPLSGLDLVGWNSNFGSAGTSTTSDLTAVPEPTARIMMFLALLAISYRRG